MVTKMKTVSYSQVLQANYDSLPNFETYLESCGISKEHHRNTSINLQLLRKHKVLPKFTTKNKKKIIIQDNSSLANRRYEAPLTTKGTQVFILRSDLRKLTEKLNLVKA